MEIEIDMMMVMEMESWCSEAPATPLLTEFGESFCTIVTEPCSMISTLSTETAQYQYTERFPGRALPLPPSLSGDSITVAECLSVMIQKEQTFLCQDYLSPGTLLTDETIIVTPADRTKMVEWCYDFIDKCQLDREIVAIAMNLVDRFFSKPNSSTITIMHFLQVREQYQLLVVTALYMSIKVHKSEVLGSNFFADVSRGLYSVKQIEDTELMILKQLEYRLCSPTSIQMANHILSLFLPYVNLSQSTWNCILQEVNYQNECTVFDYYFSTQRPSTVAVASIINSLEQVQISEQDHKALRLALVMVTTAHAFAQPTELMDAKNKMQCLVNLSM